MVDENETTIVNKEETPAAETTPTVNGSKKEAPAEPTEPTVNDKPKEVPNNVPVEQSTPKKSSPQKKEVVQNEKEQSLLKTPERSTPQKPTKHISPIVDESPMPRTKNLVDKWEDIKKDNEKHAKATKYENEKSEKKSASSAPSRKSISTKNTSSKAEPNKNIVTLESLKMKDHIPEIKKKFCMKEKRIRETIKAFNQSYHTVNIDLKENEQKMVATKPVFKEKRVYVEDENDTDKVQRSKRVKVSELKNESDNTSLWHKFNSNRLSWKNSLISKKNEITVKDTTNDKANESLIIAPTVKHQEIKAPVRINEDTCLNIFNPSQNKSSIPMLLRLRKSIKSKDEKSQVLSKFTKSNTKPEWVNKLYMVISNDHAIPKLFDVPVHWTSLSAQMVYILDVSGEALIQFNGSESKDRDQDYAQRISKRISVNDNVPDIFEIDQENSYKDNTISLQLFWKALELENYTEEERKKILEKNDSTHLSKILEANKEKNDIAKAIYVYRINEQTDSLDLIHNGSYPTFRCLNSNISMIFDFVGEVYLWQGKNSSLNARSIGIKFAQKIFNDYKRPSWASLRKINESHEPVLFQEKFKDSYLFF